MEVVILKPIFHRGIECIGIFSPQNTTLNNCFQKSANAKWSRTHGCWYIPCVELYYRRLSKALEGKAILESAELKRHLTEKKKNSGNENSHLPVVTIPGKKASSQNFAVQPTKKTFIASKENKDALFNFEQQLVLRSYSPSTIKTYRNEFTQFLQLIGNKPASQFTVQRIKDYMQYCAEKLKLSENTLHSRINALKFYYEQVLNREKFFWDIPRPKKAMLLPKLLNETELRNLFNALPNKKHKAMLFTAYSAGLRVSEIINLKIGDVDSKRMQLFISRAKGKKDRYVNLSPLLLDILRKYLQEYKPRPKKYLFESGQTNLAYPTRTVQQIFTNAKHKARINKEVGVHSLRHSFATHLLDKGTDIKYIKDLLGHFDIKTTERYLHVSNRQLVNIVSPFDDLYKNEPMDW
jgi:integrase/recombinase XerD